MNLTTSTRRSALILCVLVGGVAKVSHRPASDLGALQARLTLIALRASVPTGEQASVSEWVLLPEHTIFTRESLLAFLIRQPKPLECRARSVDGRMEVKCQPPAQLTRFAFNKQGAAETARRIRSSYPDIADPALLIVGREESMVVPLSAYELWASQYFVDHCGETSDWGPAPNEAQTVGAQALIRLWSTHGMRGTATIGPDSSL